MNGQGPIEDVYREAAKGCAWTALIVVAALIALGWLIGSAF